LNESDRSLSRKIQGNDALKDIFTGDLLKVFTLQKQQRHSKGKVYLWHAPETECIDKGKAHNPYEFGCKVSVTTNINPARGDILFYTVARYCVFADTFYYRLVSLKEVS
jgi:hypothetical protein